MNPVLRVGLCAVKRVARAGRPQSTRTGSGQGRGLGGVRWIADWRAQGQEAGSSTTGSPTDCRAGGRSASFRPSAFPGQATKRASLALRCPWGAWPPIPLRFVFTQPLRVRSVRRPGAQAWARLFFAAPLWAGGRSGGAGHTPAPLSGGGGPFPLPRGGCRAAASPLSFRAAACGTPFWPSPPARACGRG